MVKFMLNKHCVCIIYIVASRELLLGYGTTYQSDNDCTRNRRTCHVRGDVMQQ
jgi:hypothetical protein